LITTCGAAPAPPVITPSRSTSLTIRNDSNTSPAAVVRTITLRRR
jgi:hypothetical protein